MASNSVGVPIFGSSMPTTTMFDVSDPRSMLPKLTQETELQKLLADEKMRAEQHRTNYETLKAEHTRLQAEYNVLQTELKSTVEESKLVQEKYKSLLEELRKELAEKNRKCQELSSQTLTSQKLELLRIELTDEIEKKFRERYTQLEEQVESYRSEYNKVKYEFSFLKSEYEHEKVENQRIIEEMKMRHESEVSNLRKEREALIARQQAENSIDSQRVRVLQRENTQLHLKMKAVLTELEEVRAQREHTGLQSENISRLQNKQLAEHAANVRALETERESLKMQCANLQKEISNNGELQVKLMNRIHDLEKENIELKNRADETSHKCKVDLTNLKIEMLKERGELERERDQLQNQTEELKTQLDISKHTIDQQAEALVDKEREAVKRTEAAREDVWQKLNTVENEKLELETKLQEIERLRIDEESHKHAEREKVEERIRQAEEKKQEAEKELLVVKTKLQHQQALLESIERERSENSDLKNRLHRIESAYNSYVGSDRELIDANASLKRQVEELKNETDKLKAELRRSQDEADRLLIQRQSSWTEEKLNLQRRIEELDTQVTDLHNNLTRLVTTHQKKKKKYCNLITKLKHRLSLYQAKNEELTIEREVLKNSIPASTHLMLKKQLKDLLRRHHDFKALLLTSNIDEVNIGNLSFASVSVPLNASSFHCSDVEKQHQKELELLKERLDLLDDQQKQQLNELKEFTPMDGLKQDLKALSPIEISQYSSPVSSDTEDKPERGTGCV